jgi:hypothetical protein
MYVLREKTSREIDELRTKGVLGGLFCRFSSFIPPIFFAGLYFSLGFGRMVLDNLNQIASF